jgi:hypothetical protein
MMIMSRKFIQLTSQLRGVSMPNSFPWYAYICGPYYNPKNFVLDLGQIKVVGSGNDHDTFKDDLRAIAHS